MAWWGMTNSQIMTDQAVELKRLQAALVLAQKRAAEALRTYGTPLAGKLLQRAEAEAAKVAKIKQQIEALTA